MTVAEQMEKRHGSTRSALKACIAEGLNNAEIGRRYRCSANYIGRMLKLAAIENPNKGKPVNELSMLGISTTESRKEVTSACKRGEELSRERLLAQVKHIKKDSPEFDAVAADIMRQRETCQGISFLGRHYDASF